MEGDCLHIISCSCYTDSESVSFYEIDAATDSQIPTGRYVPEDGGFAGHVLALEQDYLIVESNGMVRRINDVGELIDTVYECSASAADPEAGDFIGAAAELFSPSEYDTVTVPVMILAALLILGRI